MTSGGLLWVKRWHAGVELVHEGENGYLVNPEDVTELADSINKALSGDLKAMGQRSYEIISGYTYEEMAKRHIEIFEIFSFYHPGLCRSLISPQIRQLLQWERLRARSR